MDSAQGGCGNPTSERLTAEDAVAMIENVARLSNVGVRPRGGVPTRPRGSRLLAASAAPEQPQGSSS